MKTYKDYFTEAGLDFDMFWYSRRLLTRLEHLQQRLFQRRIYDNFMASGRGEAEYLKYHPTRPNPTAPTQQEQDEYKRLNEEANRNNDFLYYRFMGWQQRLLKKTTILLYLLGCSDDFLMREGWTWPIKVKKLINKKGWYLLGEQRVRFLKAPDDAQTIRVGTLLRNMAGMGHTIMEVSAISPCGTVITYGRKYVTNHGLALVAPDSKKPVTITLDTFLNHRSYRIVEMSPTS